MYEYRARLTQGRLHPVYDADTVRLTVDPGFGLTFNLGSCRLFGINAPEMRGQEREKGILARDFVRDILGAQDAFTIHTIKDKKGKYGRYLVKIYLDDGTYLNDLIVSEGHAVAREY